MDSLRTVIVVITTGVLSYFKPISGEIQALIILFTFNFLAGLLAGLLVDNDKFRFKKAFRCIFEATCLVVFISAMYSIGEMKGEQELVLQGISYVSYVVIWFYLQNILRNMKMLFKTGAAHNIFAFLYYVISVEFIKRIPFLAQYFDIQKPKKQ